MKKVFIVHGFEGSPNGGWRPWLMAELDKKDIYACALSMPTPDRPIVKEWVEEISRNVLRNKKDQIILVGHSLGVPAILRFLESYKGKKIEKAILVAGPCQHITDKKVHKKLHAFLDKPFSYKTIKSKVKKFFVIHGDNDPRVPLEDAHVLVKELKAKLSIVKNGGHLNGSSGHYTLEDGLNAILN